jgi:hypothetical protein
VKRPGGGGVGCDVCSKPTPFDGAQLIFFDRVGHAPDLRQGWLTD